MLGVQVGRSKMDFLPKFRSEFEQIQSFSEFEQIQTSRPAVMYVVHTLFKMLLFVHTLIKIMLCS